MLAFAVGAGRVVIAASRASGGVYAGIAAQTIGTSGQFPIRLAISVLIPLVVLSDQLQIDIVPGALVAGAVVRALLERRHDEALSACLDGVGSASLVPIFFITSGVRLDVAALFAVRLR